MFALNTLARCTSLAAGRACKPSFQGTVKLFSFTIPLRPI